MNPNSHGRLALALLGLFALSCATPEPYAGLPWIENDYTAALAEAKQRDLPIFVESWAPW